MTYVDSFVVPVPEENLTAYKRLARTAGKIWKENGALQYVECIADDVPVGKRTDFYRSVKLKENEVLVFAYIVYKNRRQRDAVLKKSIADPRMPQDVKDLPFDANRLIWGGFKGMVEL